MQRGRWHMRGSSQDGLVLFGLRSLYFLAFINVKHLVVGWANSLLANAHVALLCWPLLDYLCVYIGHSKTCGKGIYSFSNLHTKLHHIRLSWSHSGVGLPVLVVFWLLLAIWFSICENTHTHTPITHYACWLMHLRDHLLEQFRTNVSAIYNNSISTYSYRRLIAGPAQHNSQNNYQIILRIMDTICHHYFNLP